VETSYLHGLRTICAFKEVSAAKNRQHVSQNTRRECRASPLSPDGRAMRIAIASWCTGLAVRASNTGIPNTGIPP